MENKVSSKIKPIAKVYTQIILSVLKNNDIEISKIKPITRGARHLSISLRLKDHKNIKKSIEIANQISSAAKTNNVIARLEDGYVNYQLNLQESLWQWYTRDDVTGFGVGLGEQKKQIDFTFSKPHALFAGTSGSGKTEAIKSALFALFTEYNRENLQTIIIDQKNELSDFNNVTQLLTPIAITESDVFKSCSLAEAELERRIQHPNNKNKIIIVIDELSMLPREALETISKISKIGRSLNINLIIGDQEPKRSSNKLYSIIIGNLLNRFIGQVDSASASSVLAGHSGVQAHKLLGSGDFLHIENGLAERFQIAQVKPNNLETLERGIVTKKKYDLPLIKKSNRVGNPGIKLEVKWLAYYIKHGHKLSYVKAAEKGISRRRHEKYLKHYDDYIKYMKLL